MSPLHNETYIVNISSTDPKYIMTHPSMIQRPFLDQYYREYERFCNVKNTPERKT